MARLIDVNAFLRDTEERYCKPCIQQGKDCNQVMCRACWVDDMRHEVADAPAVEAVPVVHGHLTSTGHDEAYCEWGYCSNCGESNIMGVNYCNWCGAILHGGEG